MSFVFDPRLEFYAITDQASARGRTDLEVAQALIIGGATCLQYRAKRVSASEQLNTARLLARLCRESGTLFIVNDRLDIALAVEADGVHVGQEDLSIASIRTLATQAGRPNIIVGKSTHSLEQARAAQEEGAHYIGCGPIFETKTKENNVPPIGLEVLAKVLSAIPIPSVAIGGIKQEHMQALADQGTQHLAVVTALTGAEDVAFTTKEYVRQWSQLRINASRRTEKR